MCNCHCESLLQWVWTRCNRTSFPHSPFHLALFTKDCRNSTASNLLRPPLGTNPSPKLAIDTVSAAILARAQEARQVDNVSRWTEKTDIGKWIGGLCPYHHAGACRVSHPGWRKYSLFGNGLKESSPCAIHMFYKVKREGICWLTLILIFHASHAFCIILYCNHKKHNNSWRMLKGLKLWKVSKVATLSSQFARRWAHFLPDKAVQGLASPLSSRPARIGPRQWKRMDTWIFKPKKKHVNMSHYPTISVVVGNQRIPEKSIAPPTHSAILSLGSSFGSSPRPYHLSRIWQDWPGALTDKRCFLELFIFVLKQSLQTKLTNLWDMRMRMIRKTGTFSINGNIPTLFQKKVFSRKSQFQFLWKTSLSPWKPSPSVPFLWKKGLSSRKSFILGAGSVQFSDQRRIGWVNWCL